MVGDHSSSIIRNSSIQGRGKYLIDLRLRHAASPRSHLGFGWAVIAHCRAASFFTNHFSHYVSFKEAQRELD